jgi:ATP-dependent helicase/nuclease subunit A
MKGHLDYPVPTPGLPDEQVRQAALDVRRSVHLEAPAGSGKTWLLTGRFLRLLAEVDHPHEILALTFTNKAVGEMRQRIRELLDRAAKGSAPMNPAEIPLLEAAALANRRQPAHRLAASDGLRIMTFHGFCLDLVQRAPVEAGIAPGSRVMADEEQQLLRHQVAGDAMRGLLRRTGNDPLRRAMENRLLRLNNNWPTAQDELAGLLERRDQLDDVLRLLGSDPKQSRLAYILEKRLAGLVELRLDNCRQALAATALGKDWPAFVVHLLRHGANAGTRLPETLPGTSWADLALWLEIAAVLTTAEGKPRKQVGPAAGFYSGFSKTPWAEAILDLSPEALARLRHLKSLPSSGEDTTDLEALYDLVLVLGEVLDQYLRVRRQRHLLDYIDLEQAALRLFNEGVPTDLQLFMDRRIRHLLVDEFQDTSRSQWELLQNLCTGWSPEAGRTLFLVGDPKQSIYAFRKAEVSLFIEARDGLPLPGQDRLALESLHLEANFRSHPRLVTWCNRLFGRTIMRRADSETDEVPYVAARAVTEPGPDHLSLAVFAGGSEAGDLRGAEARWLGSAVCRELERLAPEERIGILLFTRTHLPRYLEALQEAGVAVQVQEGLPLLEQREVAHLRQIAHALVRPQDDLAWAALLRAPWCRLTLQELVLVAGESPEGWPEKIRNVRRQLPAAGKLFEAMAGARQRLGRDELAALVEDIWLELDGPEAVANLASRAGVANCRRFLEILAQAEQGLPEETLERAELSLQNAYTPVDPGAAPSPVEMMTVHRAKGLEFDVVFLPFLDWHPLAGGRSSPPPYLLERMPGPGGGHVIAMAPDRRRTQTGCGYRLLQEIRGGKELAEAKRLFYVAATRARRSLYLSGLAKVGDGALGVRQESPLHWLTEHHLLRVSQNGALIAEHGDDLELLLNPPVDAAHLPKGEEISPLPDPLSFSPEVLAYNTVAPSQLAVEHQAVPEEEEDVSARARGVVTHRILQHLGQSRPLPGAAAVAIALRREEVPESQATGLAEDILEEIQLCLEEPFFAWLLRDDHAQAYCEWALEDLPTADQIRVGMVDRVVFDGSFWWVVDYKTSRASKGESEVVFLQREAERYRPQVLAYQEMVAHALDLDRDKIRPALYFTALQRKVELITEPSI